MTISIITNEWNNKLGCDAYYKGQHYRVIYTCPGNAKNLGIQKHNGKENKNNWTIIPSSIRKPEEAVLYYLRRLNTMSNKNKSESSFSDIIKKARKEANLTLRAAAKKLNISNPYLSQLENGKVKNPAPYIIDRLSRHFNLDKQLLFDSLYYNDFSEISFDKESKTETIIDEKDALEVIQYLRDIFKFGEDNAGLSAKKSKFIKCFLDNFLSNEKKQNLLKDILNLEI